MTKASGETLDRGVFSAETILFVDANVLLFGRQIHRSIG